MHLSGDPRYGQIDATPSWIHYLIYFGDCGTVGYSSLTSESKDIALKIYKYIEENYTNQDNLCKIK